MSSVQRIVGGVAAVGASLLLAKTMLQNYWSAEANYDPEEKKLVDMEKLPVVSAELTIFMKHACQLLDSAFFSVFIKRTVYPDDRDNLRWSKANSLAKLCIELTYREYMAANSELTTIPTDLSIDELMRYLLVVAHQKNCKDLLEVYHFFYSVLLYKALEIEPKQIMHQRVSHDTAKVMLERYISVCESDSFKEACKRVMMNYHSLTYVSEYTANTIYMEQLNALGAVINTFLGPVYDEFSCFGVSPHVLFFKSIEEWSYCTDISVLLHTANSIVEDIVKTYDSKIALQEDDEGEGYDDDVYDEE